MGIIEHDKDSDELIGQLYENIWPRFKSYFPLIKVRTSSRDSPFIFLLVKHLLKKIKKGVCVHDEETTFRL